MAYLTDKEKRLLFSALSMEKEVCKKVDKEYCREPYEETLESVVKSLERKFYYDIFEKEIRNKAISEFAERMCDRSCEESFRAVINGVPYDILTQDAVADLAWEIEKELKGGAV